LFNKLKKQAVSEAVVTEARVFRDTRKLMGNRFEFCVVTSDEGYARECLDAAVREVQRIEALLTTFRDDSQTNAINAKAGVEPVIVDQEVFDLIYRSIKISELTQGAFDITYGSIDKRFWNFDTTMTSLPDPQTARKAVRLINYRNVILNAKARTVFLKEKGMRIGFGGIGKGYAADAAKKVLQAMGVTSGIVNASGDLAAWGYQPSGKPWTIGIADPQATHHPFSWLEITDRAVATSGNYERFVMIGGKRYAHTIDPKTGFPVHGIKSVTIISPNAELSDSLATPVTVMGVRVGLDMINQMKGIACIIVDDHDQVHTSKNINILPS
jgi:thiamine biosynthesis lipoprotein